MEAPRPDPVVVYAALEDDAYLQDLFATYTEESGVLVIVRRGAPADIVDDLIDNKISPPADVLITRSVTDVWRAAEEGALRPLYSDAVKEQLPEWSRDPDDLWFGTSYTIAVIVHSMADSELAGLPDFGALAQPRFEGELCLSSSGNPVNRAVIAMMIETMGERPAELAVRGWIRNLALPVFDTEARLIAAVAAGTCRLGIVSSTALAVAMVGEPQPDVRAFTPATTYADIDGIGVARHARNPEGAAALLEWMLAPGAQTALASGTSTFPANPSAKLPEELAAVGSADVSDRNVGLVAWHADAARLLAERARYRD